MKWRMQGMDRAGRPRTVIVDAPTEQDAVNIAYSHGVTAETIIEVAEQGNALPLPPPLKPSKPESLSTQIRKMWRTVPLAGKVAIVWVVVSIGCFMLMRFTAALRRSEARNAASTVTIATASTSNDKSLRHKISLSDQELRFLAVSDADLALVSRDAASRDIAAVARVFDSITPNDTQSALQALRELSPVFDRYLVRNRLLLAVTRELEAFDGTPAVGVDSFFGSVRAKLTEVRRETERCILVTVKDRRDVPLAVDSSTFTSRMAGLGSSGAQSAPTEYNRTRLSLTYRYSASLKGWPRSVRVRIIVHKSTVDDKLYPPLSVIVDSPPFNPAEAPPFDGTQAAAYARNLLNYICSDLVWCLESLPEASRVAIEDCRRLSRQSISELTGSLKVQPNIRRVAYQSQGVAPWLCWGFDYGGASVIFSK